MTAAAAHRAAVERAPVAGGKPGPVPARVLAPVLVLKVLSGLPSSGSPLPLGPRLAMENRFGHDFGAVRLHDDSYAATTAHRFEARALTVGTDILFGSGQLRTSIPDGQELLAHELTHVTQQRTAGEVAVQLDAIADVENLLSYRVLDWAITDADALEALAILQAIPDGDLGQELSRLGQEYVDRLLDNLPDAAKSGTAYTRIVRAFGTVRIVPQATNLLSYGVFDLAITDTEVSQVFNTFTNLREADREKYLAELEMAHRLSRLVANSNSGHHRLYLQPWIKTLLRGRLSEGQRDLLRVIVRESDDIGTLTLAAETRFDMAVGPTTIQSKAPVNWVPERLRETYLTLDLLPEAHVAHNKELLRLGQFSKPAEDVPGDRSQVQLNPGYYANGELAINIAPSVDLPASIRHETGHAVAAQLNWLNQNPGPADPRRGGWKTYATLKLCAEEMIQDAQGGLSTQIAAAERSDVVSEIGKAMAARTVAGLKDTVRRLAWFRKLTAAQRKGALADPTFTAIEVGLEMPYLMRPDDGGVHLDKHVYQESYELRWVRYEHQARARMVSPYQFRSPGEWFAEAYAFYYQPDDRGRGAKLGDKDPDTKQYFDNEVHKLAASR